MATRKKVVKVSVVLHLSEKSAQTLTPAAVLEIWDKVLDNQAFISGQYEWLGTVSVVELPE